MGPLRRRCGGIVGRGKNLGGDDVGFFVGFKFKDEVIGGPGPDDEEVRGKGSRSFIDFMLPGITTIRRWLLALDDADAEVEMNHPRGGPSPETARTSNARKFEEAVGAGQVAA